MLLIALLFVLVFLMVVGCVSLGLWHFRSKQKQQIRSMLRKAEENPAEQRSEFMRPADVDDLLARFLRRFQLMDRLDLILEQAGKNWSGSKLIVVSLISSGLGCLAALRIPFLPSFVAMPLTGCLGGAIPLMLVLRKRKKAIAAFEEQFPEALDFIARSMRAGHGFSVALEMLSTDSPDPLGSAFRRVSNDLQLGSSLEVAMSKLVILVPLIDIRFFVSSVLLQQETGGNLGEILSKLASIIRERFRLKGQVKAASAHGRITGLVLVLMPLAVVGFMMFSNPEYLQQLTADALGRGLIYGAVIGQIIGYMVIRKITNIKV